MRLLAACALALVGACKAELADPGGQITATLDSSVEDAAITVTVDAPIDARACAGGDARAVDPATGTCVVYVATPAPYAAAKAACTAMNAKLGVIKSATTNATVLGLVGTTSALIGATDAATEGTFLWLEDAADPLSGAYTNWRTGEPNNGGVDGPQEDCVVIEGARAGTWDDRPCTLNAAMTAGAYPYVCQY